uniref:Major capsid protein N-terminal domain-containing protein n=1 Tax=viral metagenome TaxID=1070528 RepID=A0A6C0D245_9ZZZZ
MPGGLLNIIAIGNNNVILTGNPSKTFFKVTYSKYSNFGLQKFRIDYDGLRDLRLTESSTFTFKIPRYAELLMDTYLVVTIPDIWSPIHEPVVSDVNLQNGTGNNWAPYEFRWIKNLGAMMIEEVLITCGSLTLHRYSGAYLSAMVERDFSSEKKDLFNRMTGNIPEFYDPANAFNRANAYPSAFYTPNSAGAEPSIRGRNLYIPINTWFTLNSGCAFPLIALQYNELNISVTLRPIQELFQVRDVYDIVYNRPYIQPDFNQNVFQMYRFLQTPPAISLTSSNYQNKISTWNSDIHLISTFCFLSKEEAKMFAMEDHVYLLKDVFEYKFENITGAKRIQLQSNGMIANWMWYLQRNDVNLRNEWSNYTNWPYSSIPSDLVLTFDPALTFTPSNGGVAVMPSINPDGINTGITQTGDFVVDNRYDILETMGILLDGEYRENVQTRGIYDYVEKYTRTQGFAKEGLYCYNFCLNTSPFEYQPSGAINLSKFRTIELELTTYVPPIDPINSSFDIICDGSGNPVGVRKSNWRLYDYNFNLTVFEERYNVLSFVGGNAGMLYAR